MIVGFTCARSPVSSGARELLQTREQLLGGGRVGARYRVRRHYRHGCTCRPDAQRDLQRRRPGATGFGCGFRSGELRAGGRRAHGGALESAPQTRELLLRQRERDGRTRADQKLKLYGLLLLPLTASVHQRRTG